MVIRPQIRKPLVVALIHLELIEEMGGVSDPLFKRPSYSSGVPVQVVVDKGTETVELWAVLVSVPDSDENSPDDGDTRTRASWQSASIARAPRPPVQAQPRMVFEIGSS